LEFELILNFDLILQLKFMWELYIEILVSFGINWSNCFIIEFGFVITIEIDIGFGLVLKLMLDLSLEL